MSDRPIRVQLRRTKGWRMPENTVSVARPWAFGNPFPIGEEGPLGRIAPDAEGAVGFFRAMLADVEMRAEAGYPSNGTVSRDLRSKNLACWCPLCDLHKAGKPFGVQCDHCSPCHSDVLGELANPTLTGASNNGEG